GAQRLPLALQGAPGGVVSINNGQPYRLELGGDPGRQKARRKLLEDLANGDAPADPNGMLQFVRRRELQTYSTLDRLQEVLKSASQDNRGFGFSSLAQKLQLIARLIDKGFGTRVFYVSLDGFDTHSGQAESHRKLMQELGDALAQFFDALKQG